MIDFNGNVGGIDSTSGNENERFRYLHFGNTVVPDLSWVREVIGQLVREVEPHVLAAEDRIRSRHLAMTA